DLDSGLLNLCAFWTARHQNRIRVVDVRVNLPARRRLAQQIKAAVADRQMIHLSRAAWARRRDSEFAVTPECAVKQDDIGCIDCIAQFLSQFANTRREQRSRSGRVITELKCDAPGQFNSSKTDAVTQRLKLRADLSPFDSAEPAKDAIDPRERCSRFISCVNDQWRLLLPQQQ